MNFPSPPTPPQMTPEQIFFVKIMVLISIVVLICWYLHEQSKD